MAGASILGVIMGKLRYRKKLYFIILFKVDECLKVSFYYTILFFGLPICLEIKSGGEILLDA